MARDERERQRESEGSDVRNEEEKKIVIGTERRESTAGFFKKPLSHIVPMSNLTLAGDVFLQYSFGGYIFKNQ